ncbi:DUF6660 family protein [Compostibacter hankyongensis]|uniref:DUF6660 family protein n=1 Tax=Compostibacter hankyongensis TaxID=1007089 RepID=UPI0031E9CAC8
MAMKQMVSLFMIMVIMALHLVPCADSFASGKRVETVSSAASDPHQDRPDSCSPFCYCACCVVHTVVKASSKAHLSPPNHPSAYTAYLEGNYIDVVLPIWQPPQLLS